MSRVTSSQGRAFGLEVGEERRYVLGPGESLRKGESGSWSLRLVRMGGAEGDEAVFELSSRVESPFEGPREEAVGQVVAEESRGTLRVNRHGFPLVAQLEVRRRLYRSGEEVFTVSYRLGDRAYSKRVFADAQEWEYAVRVPPGPNVDRDVPLGIYPYLPDSLDCMGSALRPFAFTGRSTAGRPAGRDQLGDCADGLLAFANPALAALALPALWEAGDGDHDVVFFAPTGNDLGAKTAMGLGLLHTGPGGGVGARTGGAAPGMSDGRLQRATDLKRYYHRTGLELGEAADVELGGRTVRANRIDLGGTSTDLWVDIDDRVVRADLGPHPTTGGERWIRLLQPSEY